MLEMLRDYQKEVIMDLNKWFSEHEGNPCIEAPTASGKSWIIAGYVHQALSYYPNTRIIILAPQRELIEQDREKLLKVWPKAPVSTFCAALHQKEMGTQIVIATIQSIRSHVEELGFVDLVLIDEAHMINTEDTGMYRNFINGLKLNNPYLKCIGFTATPYRMKHGLITDKPSLFDAPLVKTKSIKWLQDHGYLSHLQSKHTETGLDVSKVRKDCTGDFRKDELEDAVDKEETNRSVVRIMMDMAKDRHSWLIFCSGINHAYHIAEELRENGISCRTVTGDTPEEERKQILEDLKTGKLRAVTNNNVLTTGFDAPNVDMIALLRPTMSPGLYMQMLGRGLRKDPSKENTLVLDFAENTMRHGGIYDVEIPTKKKKAKGVAPMKICPDCQEYLPIQTRECPVCGHEFESETQSSKPKLSEADVETGDIVFQVRKWLWTVEFSRNGQIPMVLCRFYGFRIGDPVLKKYFCLNHDGYAGEKAYSDLAVFCSHAGINLKEIKDIMSLCDVFNKNSSVPRSVLYHPKHSFYEIRKILWE